MRPPVKGDKMPVISYSSGWWGSKLTWVAYERETTRYWIDANGTKWRKDNGRMAGESGFNIRVVPVDWTDRVHSPKHIELEQALTEARQVHTERLKAVHAAENRALEAKAEVDKAENRLFSFFTSKSMQEEDE